MDLNVKAPFFLTQALLDLLRAGHAAGHLAKVINIASIDGMSLNPWPTYSYHASKAGLIHLTSRMAAELAPQGIVVSAICPGAFASEMNRRRATTGRPRRPHPAAARGHDRFMAAARSIWLLAGDYVVGSTPVVDGGVNISRGFEPA